MAAARVQYVSLYVPGIAGIAGLKPVRYSCETFLKWRSLRLISFCKSLTLILRQFKRRSAGIPYR